MRIWRQIMEPKMKSLEHCLLAYKGELLQFELQQASSTSQELRPLLTCRHYQISDDRQRIQRCTITSIEVERPQNYPKSFKQRDVSIVRCSTISLEPLGLHRPVVLLAFTHPGVSPWFSVYVHITTGLSRLARIGSFSCPPQFDLFEAYIQLLDGPGIFCHCQSSIFISVWNSRTNLFQSSQHIVPFSAQNSIKSVIKEDQRNFLISAVVSSQTTYDECDLLGEDKPSCSNDSDWLLLRANLEQLQTLQGLDHVPSTYATITEDLLMIDSEESFEGSILLAISMSQLVLVRPDGFCRICDLPFGDVASMNLNTVGEQENVLLIASKGNGVCCVDLTNLTVIKHWPDHSAILSDDFLSAGSDQILLVRDTQEIDRSEFILTDLTNVWPSNQPGGDHDSKSEQFAHGSMLNAINALELRLQSSSNSLQKLQLQSYQKEAVIQNGHTMLDTITSKSERNAGNQSDLICIIGEDKVDEDEVCSKRQSVPVEDDGIPLKVESFWRRIIERKFICGVLILNSGTKPISDILISLIPTVPEGVSSRVIRGHSHQMYPSDNAYLSLEDKTANSHLQEGAKVWVTVATDCPTFESTRTVNFDVVLLWKEHMIDKCGDPASNVLEKRKCLMKCSLSVQDLEKLTIDVSTAKIKSGQTTKVDFLALECIQLHAPLGISTRHTSLRKIPNILCKDFGFVHVTMDTKEGLYSDSESLGGISIFYHLNSNTMMKLVVNTWDRYQLTLFLRKLSSILPFDATVTTGSKDEDFQAIVKNATLTHLHNELDEVKRLAKESSRRTTEDEACTDRSQNELITLRRKTDGAMIMLSETTSP